MIHITITVPVAHLADANQLARVLGYSEADALTFDQAQRIEVDGQTYARAAGVVDAGWLLPAYGPLVAPAWGADMSAAARAQALLHVHDQRGSEAPAEVPADPGRIVVVITS